MSNNLHISYDLYQPGQNYDDLIKKIKSLGNWAKIHKSFWYVKSNLSPSQVVDQLRPHIDTNDSLYVVDAKNNIAAWHNLNPEAGKFIRENWNNSKAA